MSKYLCQDCKSNNNGWCTVRKCNGLKKMNITSCNTYENKNAIELDNGNKIALIKGESIKGKRADSLIEDHVDESRAHRVLGKRELLWYIQMQIVGINNDRSISKEDRYDELVRCIKSLGTHLEFEENLWNVDKVVDSIIDEDMIRDSRLINESI